MSIPALNNNESTSNTQLLLDQVKDTTIGVVTGIGTALVLRETQAPLIHTLTSFGLKPVQVGVGAVGFSANAFIDMILNNLSKLPIPQWLKTKLTQNAQEAKKSQSVEFIKKSTLYLLTTFLYVYAYSYLFNDEEDHNYFSIIFKYPINVANDEARNPDRYPY